MKTMKTILFSTALAASLVAGAAVAGELRYQPVNPTFGGYAINSQHLLARASAQNKHEKPTNTADPVQELMESNRRTLLYSAASASNDYLYGKIVPGELSPRIVPLGDGSFIKTIPDPANNRLTTVYIYPDGSQVTIGYATPRG
jgi:curli production assembly/transport component CsgF